MEPDGETVKVDLREKDMNGEGEKCSSGIGELALAEGETSGGNEREEWEDLGISAWECGNEGEDKISGDPRLGFDLWTVGEQLGFCDFDVDVLIDVFEVLGVSAVGYADGLLLEDGTVQKNPNNKHISCFCRHVVTILQYA